MTLTATHAELGVLDVTDDAHHAWWPRVHKTGEALACRGCNGAMVAVERTSGGWTSRFFRHKALADCPAAAGESEDHRRLKTDLARRIRRHSGWTAELEAAGDGWRADVLATGPGGRRIAWEVQLANSAIADVKERSRRYAAAGVEVVWVALRRTGWFGHVPSLLLEPDGKGGFTVTDGARALIKRPLSDLHAVRPGRFDGPPKLTGTVTRGQTSSWSWGTLLACGGVPERLGPQSTPAWLAAGLRRCSVLWRAAKPVALDWAVWAILTSKLVAVAMPNMCTDIAAKPVQVAWLRRGDVERALPLMAFAMGWTIMPRDEPFDSCTSCGGAVLWLYGGPGWWSAACMRCDSELYELLYQVACGIEFEHERFFTAGVERPPVEAPASELVQPRRQRRRASAPIRLVW